LSRVSSVFSGSRILSDPLVLRNDIEAHGLKKGDVGAVVHCYSDEEAYEVEFVTAEGKTVALLTLRKEEIRSMSLTVRLFFDLNAKICAQSAGYHTL